MSFQNKIVVVTGGALGIGRFITEEFCKAGAKVAFIDKNRIKGEQLSERLKKDNSEVLFYCGDVGEKAVLEDFAQRVIDCFGGIDILINNAAKTKKETPSEQSYEEFNESLRVGITAPYMLTKLFLPHFKPKGSIINISSTRAFQSQKNTEAYTAAKGGITALTHALAVSLSGRVRVNSIAPGWIDTRYSYDETYVPNYSESDKKQHPSNRVGHPMDIVRGIFFLCNEENDFINGQNLTIDGGMSKLMIYTEDHGWHFDG